jgi:predicted nucleic acid-binding protein
VRSGSQQVRQPFVALDVQDAAGELDPVVRTLNQLTIGYAAWNELADRVWELRHTMTPYGAAYLALAEARGCRLVTTDGKLRDCPGRHCDVHVVTPGR